MSDVMKDVFISYNSKDKEFALDLARRLRDEGLDVWLDEWDLIPGKPWQEAIEKAVGISRTIIILIGKDGFGKWENEEARVAVDSQVSDPARSVIPVLLPGSDPKILKKKSFLKRNTWVDFKNGLDDKDAMHKLISGIKKQKPGDTKSKPIKNRSESQNSSDSSSNDNFIPFTNRKDEIDAISFVSSAQYYLIHAPSGYGKSRLLRELDGRVFKEKKWHHAYVVASKYNNLNDIAVNLSKKLNININSEEDTRPGLKLGVAIKNYYSSTSDLPKKFHGLVLLIDLDKESSSELLGKILNEFIPDIQKTIDTLRLFKTGDLPFRVIVAGRYLAMTKEAKSTSLPLDQRALSPFTYDVVKNTIDKEYSDHTLDERHKLAAHIIYLTGGHPRCMAQMLLLFKSNPIQADEFLETCEQEIRTIITNTVEEVRGNLPRGNDVFLNAIEALMVFRYVNYSVLDSLRIKYQLDVRDTFDFADLLTKNHLFTRKQPFTLQDDVVRRLISTYMRDHQPRVYVEYCIEARKLCKEILQGQDVQSPTEWTLEYLFQWLQEHSVDSIVSEEKRLNLRSLFFTDILPNALNLYLGRHAKLTKDKAKEDQIALGNELRQDRQWEFEFSVNYFLRKDLYDGTPYKELESKIAEFFEGKLKELEA